DQSPRDPAGTLFGYRRLLHTQTAGLFWKIESYSIKFPDSRTVFLRTLDNGPRVVDRCCIRSASAGRVNRQQRTGDWTGRYFTRSTQRAYDPREIGRAHV